MPCEGAGLLHELFMCCDLRRCEYKKMRTCTIDECGARIEAESRDQSPDVEFQQCSYVVSRVRVRVCFTVHSVDTIVLAIETRLRVDH